MKNVKGSIRDPKIVAKIAFANLGQKRTPESKEKMRLAKIGKKLSEESKKKIGDALRGKIRPKDFGVKISKILKGRKVPWVTGSNHWCWKGGITPETKKRINTPEWKRIRSEIYARDNWTCSKCGKHCSDDIQCDHIIPWRISHDDSSNNLQVLCKSCHMKKDVQFSINEDRICFFTIVDDRFYYPVGTHVCLNSFLRFHKDNDIDFIVFRQDMIDKVFKEKNINFYQAKPFFGEIVANMGYKLVVNCDADHIFLGRLDEILKMDYDVAMPINLNDYENSSFENITEEMYLQAGMVASTKREFWVEWQKMNKDAMKYLRKENDIVNLLIYNKMKDLKLKILDKNKDYYGCKSLGREPEFTIDENGDTICRGEKVYAYHFARGNVFPKLNIPNMPLQDEVKKRWIEIATFGQSIKIGGI